MDNFREVQFNDVKSTIGNRIRSFRKNKNITQQDLANTLKVSRNHLAQIETGRSAPSLNLLYNLTQYFDCSLDYLVGLSPIIKSKGLDSLDIYTIIEDYDVSFGTRPIAADEKERTMDFLKDCISLMDKYSK